MVNKKIQEAIESGNPTVRLKVNEYHLTRDTIQALKDKGYSVSKNSEGGAIFVGVEMWVIDLCPESRDEDTGLTDAQAIFVAAILSFVIVATMWLAL